MISTEKYPEQYPEQYPVYLDFVPPSGYFGDVAHDEFGSDSFSGSTLAADSKQETASERLFSLLCISIIILRETTLVFWCYTSSEAVA